MENKLRVLVIVGSWNSPLFSVKWINENLFDKSLPEKVDVEIVVAYDRLNTKTIKTGKIDIEISPNRLCFLANQDDNESLVRIIDIAQRLATLLPHTPYESLGLNLRYIGKKKKEIVCTFPMISGYISENQSITLSYANQEDAKHKINLIISSPIAEDAPLIYDLNFHYAIIDSVELKKYMQNDLFEQAKNISQKLLEEFENE